MSFIPNLNSFPLVSSDIYEGCDLLTFFLFTTTASLCCRNNKPKYTKKGEGALRRLRLHKNHHVGKALRKKGRKRRKCHNYFFWNSLWEALLEYQWLPHSSLLCKWHNHPEPFRKQLCQTLRLIWCITPMGCKSLALPVNEEPEQLYDQLIGVLR